MKNITPEQIDALLPQTQCGLCSFKGCMPYAEAIVFENAAINLCPPGGVETLHALGELLAQDPTPYIHDMEQKTKPLLQAVIREAECIGCTKCIDACPVDAIIGGAKQMHTVITSICTGCELCVAPCPVDCIDMVALFEKDQDIPAQISAEKKSLSRIRFNAREQRVNGAKKEKKLAEQQKSISAKQSYIEAAIARRAVKK